MPEYIVLLRRAREKHFEALQAEVASAAAQFAAYDEGVRAATARRTVGPNPNPNPNAKHNPSPNPNPNPNPSPNPNPNPNPSPSPSPSPSQALQQLPATNPSALVGEELEVQRGGEGGAAGGKFWPATVLAAPAKAGGLFTLAYKDDEANKAKVNLATTKWRPAGAPAPPRFEWSAAAD